MDKSDLLIKFETLEAGNIELTKREIMCIIIALKLVDAYDNIIDEALGID